jgi:hypothetical protein
MVSWLFIYESIGPDEFKAESKMYENVYRNLSGLLEELVSSLNLKGCIFSFAKTGVKTRKCGLTYCL